MIGAIIGDIVGSIYEGSPTKRTDFPLWGLGCHFTDDTVLTVAAADKLLHGGALPSFRVLADVMGHHLVA
jgi:ADP-ribosylglycohydrolase